MTVQPLPADMRDTMRRTANRGLMVAWINADLMERAGHDVRKSIVFYDDTGVFETALLPSQWDQLAQRGVREEFLTRLASATPVRYWRKGI